MTPLAFAVRVLPVYLLALALTGVGAAALAPHLPPAWRMPLGILLLLEFAALLTFRRTRNGSAALLFALALTAGALVGLMLAEGPLHWSRAVLAGVGIPLLMLPLGWRAGPRLRPLRWVTWMAAWGYILGWVAWQLLAPGSWARPAWGVAGLMVFSALAATWASALPARMPNEPEASLGFELYLIGLNLSLAATTLPGS
jgi:hypothetical protein